MQNNGNHDLRPTSTDGRRARGDTSRRAVMRIAVDLASVDGLEGLTIGSLATEASMSKGGVVALFGSKEQLQLATIAAARRDLHGGGHDARPRGAARTRTTRGAAVGLARVQRVRVFAGGCFFAAVSLKLGSRPGAVRDAVADQQRDWHEFLQRRDRTRGSGRELDPATDAAQLTFELTSLLDGANSMSLLFDSVEPYARARTTIARLLG